MELIASARGKKLFSFSTVLYWIFTVNCVHRMPVWCLRMENEGYGFWPLAWRKSAKAVLSCWYALPTFCMHLCHAGTRKSHGSTRSFLLHCKMLKSYLEGLSLNRFSTLWTVKAHLEKQRDRIYVKFTLALLANIQFQYRLLNECLHTANLPFPIVLG